MRFLVIDGYTKAARDELEAGGASTAATLYERMLLRWAPEGSSVDLLFPSDTGIADDFAVDRYDGIAWTGCSLCVNDTDKPEVTCQVDLQRRAYLAGVPGFGSCWAAQVAVVAAGGAVAPNPNGREMGVARKIALTGEGRAHPMFEGKPHVFDGFTSHDDEVTRLPEGATLLASNPWTRVQAVEVVYEGTPFWGLQYHPEYDLHEMARLMHTRADKLVALGFFKDRDAAQRHVDDLETVHADPSRTDLAWSLGIDADLLDPEIRQAETRNWIRSLLVLLLMTGLVAAQRTNYDESKVPAYTLPDPLEGVATPAEWTERRAHLMKLLEGHVYGRMPRAPVRTFVKETEPDPKALDGLATRREITIRFKDEGSGPAMTVLLYQPNKREGPAPAFLGLNFWGNHAVDEDPGITINPATRGRARGSRAHRWAIPTIIDRGYALATIYYGDIDPDRFDGYKDGVHPLFPMNQGSAREKDAWGSICAWAWGLSRAMDWLVQDEAIDGHRVAVMGHSRLGKTALWAGACDERFKLVISNNSGCGGAALSRRRYGETVKRINDVMPHWFCDRFKEYNGNEDALPVDQHTLIACIAPRACLVSSAEEDRWADPKGEFLAARGADPVYRLLGTSGLPVSSMPTPGNASLGRLGYHIRPGKHDVTDADWDVFLRFADRFLR